MIHRRTLLKTVAAFPALPAIGSPQNIDIWLGREYWANPLQDWRKNGKRIECHVSGGDRNVFWLTRELTGGDFAMSVRLGRLDPPEGGPGWTGFRWAMRGHFDDYRDTAVRGQGLEAGIDNTGRLFLIEAGDGPTLPSMDDVKLELRVRGNRARLSAGGQSIEADIPSEWTRGGVAIVAHAGELPKGPPAMREPVAPNTGKPNQDRRPGMKVWFEDWKLSGTGAAKRPERAWGPILFTQYTLSRRVMKMTVQLAPVQGAVQLRLNGKKAAESTVEPLSATAHFRIENWDDSNDHAFELSFDRQTYGGTIRKDPKANNRIVAGALTCQWDLGFPHQLIASNLKRLNPDVLFFTGDQIYESNAGYAIQREPLEAARLDYLRKWYLFGWAWGDLTREIPCVCLADDHDVYHGNLWGVGGKKALYPAVSDGMQPGQYQQAGQDSGGYTMAANWVNVVYRTQSSHLPDTPDAEPIEQGITAHYGHLLWGGISFALLEDRKFKSAPKQTLPGAKIVNGWPQNPDWDSAKSGDVPGASLLGDKQERFLRAWAEDWDGAEMKAAVSGTIFCNLATLPQSFKSDAGTPQLPVLPEGEYASGEKLVQDHDSNGWPQTPRNRALRLLRAALAVHVAGDQHLASTVQYGIDDWNDGPFAICTPAISNLFPRRWYPPTEGRNRPQGAPRNMGEFREGFGNRITVHAVANPRKSGHQPANLFDRATGFGVLEFDKAARTIKLANWPRWADLSKPDAKPYVGWPVTIQQTDNGQRACGWEIPLESAVSGVITVRDTKGELVLCWRTKGPLSRIPVWKPGRYHVLAGSRDLGEIAAISK